jgi:hypothetical protein
MQGESRLRQYEPHTRSNKLGWLRDFREVGTSRGSVRSQRALGCRTSSGKTPARSARTERTAARGSAPTTKKASLVGCPNTEPGGSPPLDPEEAIIVASECATICCSRIVRFRQIASKPVVSDWASKAISRSFVVASVSELKKPPATR